MDTFTGHPFQAIPGLQNSQNGASLSHETMAIESERFPKRLLAEIELLLLAIARVHRVNMKLNHWRMLAEDCRSRCQVPVNIQVAFIGESGAGKSSLINALLEAPIADVTSLVAGTQVPTKVLYHNKQETTIEIKYTTEVALLRLIELALSDLGDNVENTHDDEELHTAAIHKLQALCSETITGRERRESLLNKIMTNEDVTKNLGQVRRVSEITTETKLWPIIDEINVWNNNPLLESGLEFVDCPGTGDDNEARATAMNPFLRASPHTVVVMDISRCGTKKIGLELSRMCAQRALDGNMAGVAFTITHTDSGLPTHPFKDKYLLQPEIQGNLLLLHESKEKARIALTALRQQRKLLDSSARSSHEGSPPSKRRKALDGRPTPGVDSLSVKQTELDMKIGVQTAELAQKHKDLQNTLALLRNVTAKQTVLNALQERLPGLDLTKIQIFTVSAPAARDFHQGDENDTFKDIEETEIPALARYLHDAAASKRRSKNQENTFALISVANDIICEFSPGGEISSQSRGLLRMQLRNGHQVSSEHGEILGSARAKLLTTVSDLQAKFLTSCSKACISLTEHLYFVNPRDPEEPLRYANTLKALCHRKGSFIGLNLNDRLVDIPLNNMKNEWGHTFDRIIPDVLNNLTKDLLNVVSTHVAGINAIKLPSGDALCARLAQVGENQLSQFQISITREIAQARVELVHRTRIAMREALSKEVQEKLSPVYEMVGASTGDGMLKDGKTRIMSVIKNDVLKTLPQFFGETLGRNFIEVVKSLEREVETLGKGFAEAYSRLSEACPEDENEDKAALQAHLALEGQARKIKALFSKYIDGSDL